MPRTKDTYVLTGDTVADLKRELNSILSRIADRMDKQEGIRGTAEVEGEMSLEDVSVGGDITVLDDEGEQIHSME